MRAILRPLAVVALAAAVPALTACRGATEPPTDVLAESTDHQRTARLVSHVTDGLVSRDASVTVRFVAAHVGREGSSRRLTDAFAFTPPLEGSASWTDERTLVFDPRTPLTAGGRYRCVLDVAAVLPDVENATPFAFGFEVAPNRLVAWDAELRAVDERSPEQMLLTGSLRFQDAVPLDDIRGAVRLEADSRKVGLEWRADAGDRTFVFTSAPVARRDRPVELELIVPAAPFGIERDARRTVVLRPVSDMAVTEVRLHDDEQEPRLSVHFSDPLEEGADHSAYVTVDPHLDLQVTAADRTLLVSGPFQRDREYTLTLRRGIANRWGGATGGSSQHPVRFVDLAPRITFSQSGALLPSRGNRTIAFRTLNVARVTARVMRVFESNLGQFLQDADLASPPGRDRIYSDLNRVGVEVASRELEIGDTRNTWLQSTLDLGPLVDGHERGLYLVTLDFDRSQMLYDCDPEDSYSHWEHPCGHGYAWSHGTVTKPVIHSDVGLIAKRTADGLLVAATHLADATPLPGVEVTLVSYQNQPLETAVTDADGIARFEETNGFHLDARWQDQRSALKFDDSQLSFSGFEVGGASGAGGATRAFVYADRGVHRPGDTIHLAAILRNRDGSFPDGQPIGLRVRNPQGQVVHEEVAREGLRGHYAFSFATGAGDPTGAWYADLYNGAQLVATHRLRVETVAPNRLKVRLELPAERLAADAGTQRVKLASSYLFGAPAAGLQATVDLRLGDRDLVVEAYPEFVFRHPARRLVAADERAFDGTLDGDGRAGFDLRLPDLDGAPSAVAARLTARVFEKGGRPTTQAVTVPVDPYPVYVGIAPPDRPWVRADEPLELAVVAVDPDGRPLPGRELEVHLYHGDRNWWWEYASFDDYRLRFKSDVTTRLVETSTVTSGDGAVPLRLSPSESGQLLVEVVDAAGGHATGAFLWASAWGQPSAPLQTGSQLEMEVDRPAYGPGDTATVSVATPAEGVAFVSVEKGDRVLEHRWIPLTGTTTLVEVPITREMLPNAYVHVMAIQPHAQTANDRPMRLHGVVPIAVEEPDTRLPLEVRVADTLRPDEEFEVEVRAPAGRDATVTVAVVDEGLLDLTSFDSPDPWAFFFAKERLGVTTFDLYDLVIGAMWGDVHRRFEVGGDEDSFRTDRVGPTRARRFPPVALFAEPVAVDRDGVARARFTMPHYLGSVRVMAVAADGSSYGHAEATVPVRDPVILLPTLPRVAGPGERFVMPVTVFALEEGIGPITVELSAEGPLTVEGDATAEVRIDGAGERDLGFRIAAADRAGVARVTVRARSVRFETATTTELEVRPVNPFVYGGAEHTVPARETVELEIPALGLDGTRAASLRLSPVPGLRFGNRLSSLIRYPYGCMEQTMSAVFPQLELKPVLAAQARDGRDAERRIDANIDAGIRRLQRFVTPEGGFATWPGGTETDQWATNYGGHFLLEARRAGHWVPDHLLEPWLDFQRRMAAREAGDLKTRCYRLFLLAHAGAPATGPMNLMKEERLDVLDPASLWLLAAAYHLSGMPAAAGQVLDHATIDVAPYRETGGTYGTELRDTAMMLYLAELMEREQVAGELFGRVNAALGAQRWLNTHETGYALLAVGEHLQRRWRPDAEVRARVEVRGRQVPLDRDGGVAQVDVRDAIGGDVTVRSSSDAPLYAVLEWEGIPVDGPTEPELENLSLEVRFLDREGVGIDPSQLPQGTVFWCHLRVGLKTGDLVENVALTQIFPSGWEIDATRLRGEAMPEWSRRWQLGQEDYLDVRDDRAMWFFDLYRRRPLDFMVQLLAVTEGEFVLAPAAAEAMYDRDFRALVPGGPVRVTGAGG